MTRLFLVDDHALVLLGLEALFGAEPDLSVVGKAETAASALRQIESLAPDVVLLDLRLPDQSGIEVCRQIHHRWPKVQVLILTSYSDDEMVMAAIQAGASGYALKQLDTAELLSAVRAVARGDAVAAKEHFTNALKLSPGNVPARVGLADSLLRLGEFDGCEGMLRPLVKGGNESLAGTVLLAKLRIAQERYDEAEALIEKAKDLGANRDHILKLQFSVAEATKDLTKTVALLEELIKEDPGSADKHAELGNVYVLSQRPDDAEREYMKAIELEPRHVQGRLTHRHVPPAT